MVHGSWFMVHGSWYMVMVHNPFVSQFTLLRVIVTYNWPGTGAPYLLAPRGVGQGALAKGCSIAFNGVQWRASGGQAGVVRHAAPAPHVGVGVSVGVTCGGADVLKKATPICWTRQFASPHPRLMGHGCVGSTATSDIKKGARSLVDVMVTAVGATCSTEPHPPVGHISLYIHHTHVIRLLVRQASIIVLRYSV